jgi:hypothetical protein
MQPARCRRTPEISTCQLSQCNTSISSIYSILQHAFAQNEEGKIAATAMHSGCCSAASSPPDLVVRVFRLEHSRIPVELASRKHHEHGNRKHTYKVLPFLSLRMEMVVAIEAGVCCLSRCDPAEAFVPRCVRKFTRFKPRCSVFY